MNTLVIFSVVFCVLLTLYFIGYGRQNVLLQRLSLPFLLPCSIGVAIPFLLSRMPDSYHIFFFSTIAVILASLAISIEPLSIKKKHAIENILFIISTAIWFVIFFPVFYIQKVSVSLIVITAFVYMLCVVFFCIKFVIKSIRQFVPFFFLMVISFLINFIAIVTIIYTRKIYSFFFLAGTVLMIVFVLTSSSTRFKTGITNSKIIVTLLFVFEELCIYAASVLMLV